MNAVAFQLSSHVRKMMLWGHGVTHGVHKCGEGYCNSRVVTTHNDGKWEWLKWILVTSYWSKCIPGHQKWWFRLENISNGGQGVTHRGAQMRQKQSLNCDVVTMRKGSTKDYINGQRKNPKLLDASSHLYTRVCPSVCLSVCLSTFCSPRFWPRF